MSGDSISARFDTPTPTMTPAHGPQLLLHCCTFTMMSFYTNPMPYSNKGLSHSHSRSFLHFHFHSHSHTLAAFTGPYPFAPTMPSEVSPAIESRSARRPGGARNFASTYTSGGGGEGGARQQKKKKKNT